MPTGETLAEVTPSPVPLPPPTPTTGTASSSPASTHRHRRHRNRTFSSSASSSSSSFLSTVSSAASSPSPSPRSLSTTTATSVPFSWEHHPGIPKTTRLLPTGAGTPSSSSSAPTPLPLPPPLRAPPPPTSSRPRHHHHHHARRRRTISCKPRPADDGPFAAALAEDPFAAALAECTRERGAGGAGSEDNAGLMDALFPACAPPASNTSRRWSSIASAGALVGLLDLYGCRSAMGGGGGVAEGAFVVRRPVAVVRAVPAGRACLGRAGRR